MPVVGDFNVIQANPVVVGDRRDFNRDFYTGGREDSEGYLIFNIKDYVDTTYTVQVYINNILVGRIYPYHRENRSYWFSQSIVVQRGVLKSRGANTMHINAAPLEPEQSTPRNRLDDFWIKDMAIFFHQKA